MKYFARYNTILVMVLLLASCLLMTGCTGGAASAEKKGSVIRLAYFGEIYEAPLFVAVQKNFFREEGLDVELVKLDFNSLKDEVSRNAVDGTTCDYRIFRSLEQGLDIKLAAGLHSECAQIVTLPGSGINSIADLKSRKIGVAAEGNAAMVVASLLLKKNGIDPGKDIRWKLYPEDKLEDALRRGEVEALNLPEPADVKKDRENKDWRVVFSAAEYQPEDKQQMVYRHFFASFAGLSGRLVTEQPKKAFDLTKVWVKAAKWVSENPEEAVRLSVENNYVEGSYELNANWMKYSMWMPGVRNTRDNINAYIKQQKELEVLSPDLDEKEFLNKICSQILPDLGRN